MASIKNLKKDVEFIISELISDCYIYMYFNNNSNYDKVTEIISEAVVLRNELFERINQPKIEDTSKTKQYYKQISKDLLSGADILFKKLSDLSK